MGLHNSNRKYFLRRIQGFSSYASRISFLRNVSQAKKRLRGIFSQSDNSRV